MNVGEIRTSVPAPLAVRESAPVAVTVQGVWVPPSNVVAEAISVLIPVVQPVPHNWVTVLPPSTFRPVTETKAPGCPTTLSGTLRKLIAPP
jgi:hypothetical protein